MTKCIVPISGFQANIFDEKVLFKNKFLKERISKKVKILLEKYAEEFLNNRNLNITFDDKADLFLNSKKIGSIYKGESLFKPKVIIKNNNNYLRKKKFIRPLKEKIKIDIKKNRPIFWEPDSFLNIEIKT